ncbi:MAG: diguanylate cyclase [Calditrichaceae bacterium]|nr:diguanylate cyclase [Calditrichaceae bacterium]
MKEKTNKKILYIEDDPEARLLMADIFRYKGYIYIEASRGLEGIQLAKEHLPDLILIDLQLPDIQGYEVTTHLKSLPEIKSTPIIALTASTEREIKELVLTAGCDGYISKPINITEFLFNVEEYLAGKKDIINPENEKAFLQKYNIQLVSRLKKKIIELEGLNKNLKKLNRELYDSRDYLSQYNDRLFYMNNLANHLRTQNDPQKMARVLPQKMVEGFQVDRCIVFNLNIDNGSLQYFASAGIPSSELAEFNLKLSEDFIKLLHDEGGILWIKSKADILDKSLLEFSNILNVNSFIICNIADLHTQTSDRIELENIRSSQLNAYNENLIFFIDKSKTKKLFATYEIRILKSFLQTISVIYENMILYSKLHQLYEKKSQEAILDGLTKLYNYRYFIQELERETNRAKRYDQVFSLFMLDIDKFKNYNDTYGHPAGDVILKTISKVLIENIRNTDTVARYGGEEFVVILPGLERDEAIVLAEKLRTLISEHLFYNEDTKENCKITISIGVACFPEDNENPSDLIKSADKALYQAKQTGRNKVCSLLDIKSKSR